MRELCDLAFDLQPQSFDESFPENADIETPGSGRFLRSLERLPFQGAIDLVRWASGGEGGEGRGEGRGGGSEPMGCLGRSNKRHCFAGFLDLDIPGTFNSVSWPGHQFDICNATDGWSGLVALEPSFTWTDGAEFPRSKLLCCRLRVTVSSRNSTHRQQTRSLRIDRDVSA